MLLTKLVKPSRRGTRFLLLSRNINTENAQLPAISTSEEAIKSIKSGHRVFVHSAAAYPNHLIQAMCRLAEGADPVKKVNVCHMHVEGSSAYSNSKYQENFRTNNFFVGASQREAVNDGRSDFVPIFLSEISRLFRTTMPIDVALISVSPPDIHGFCSLGTSVDISLDAVEHSKIVIAQVNKHVPRTHGDGLIHISRVDHLVEYDEPLPTSKQVAKTPEVEAIGKFIAALIEDRSTLQMGIGGIPDAVLSCLKGHKDLGIHTEMFSDGVIDLVKHGVITNRFKTISPHHILASFLVGSQNLYDFVNDNPLVHMAPSSYINDPAVIKQNPRVVAINCAVEVDLTGQVCADSIGSRIFSGIGGQMDFERGAAISEGGKPIIALQSRTAKNKAKIVPTLTAGAGVVTTRAHVHWVVTEFGSVNLFGLNLRQRARALIRVAHPDDRAMLHDAALKLYGKAFTTLDD